MAYLDNDGLLYFWQQIKTKFAAASHKHAIADTMGLQAALDYKATFFTRSNMDANLAQQGIATPLDYANAKTLMANAGMFYPDDSSCANVLAMAEVISALCAQIDANATIADGSVTTDKLDSEAVTTANLADGAVTWDKIDGRAVRAMHEVSLVAANSQADQALTALNFSHSTLTPAQMVVDDGYADSSYRLCWISGTSLEVAPITFFGNLQTRAVTLYAKGYKSTASGILGVDESWTITALPTDADGVSY